MHHVVLRALDQLIHYLPLKRFLRPEVAHCCRRCTLCNANTTPDRARPSSAHVRHRVGPHVRAVVTVGAVHRAQPEQLPRLRILQHCTTQQQATSLTSRPTSQGSAEDPRGWAAVTPQRRRSFTTFAPVARGANPRAEPVGGLTRHQRENGEKPHSWGAPPDPLLRSASAKPIDAPR